MVLPYVGDLEEGLDFKQLASLLLHLLFSNLKSIFKGVSGHFSVVGSCFEEEREFGKTILQKRQNFKSMFCLHVASVK